MTNRPGASETSSVLPKGALMLQTGLDYASSGLPAGNSFEETRSVTVPDVTLRFGVTDFLEIRAGAKYAIAADVTTGDIVAGLEGHRIGAHVGLFDESSFFPAAALSLNVDVPLSTFRYEHIGGEARLAFSKGLFDVLSLAANVAAGWNGVDATPFVAWTAAASGTLGPSITPFVEVFGDYAPLAGTAPTIWVDAGASWSVTDWVALDAAIGINAYGAGLSYFTSVGLSFFFPGHLFLYGGNQ